MDFEERILDPARSVGKLPDGVNLLHAGLVGPVGQAAAEGSDLRPYHPETPGSAAHVKQVLRLVLN